MQLWFLNKEKRRSPRRWGRWMLLVGLATLTAGLATQIRFTQLFAPLQDGIFWIEAQVQPWFEQQTQQPQMLLPLAFLGGLIASLSPCILCLLPINLGYIGTRDITSRKDAVVKASLFVLGVVTTLSLLGVVSSLAAAIALQFRGYINLLVGGLIVGMGLSLLGLFSMKLPRLPETWAIAGPYGFGLTFALVTSPCASPIMVSVLAAAGSTGSRAYSMLTMTSYALGYTAIIFLASLFTGLAKQARTVLVYSESILRAGSVILLVVGGYYLLSGIQWIFLMHQTIPAV
ncbi:MAG: cytochrome c biogenesis protein CcdA [Cyanobacteria bacterium J06638_20]